MKDRTLPTKKIDNFILATCENDYDLGLDQVAKDVWVFIDPHKNRIPDIIIFGKHCQTTRDYISFKDLIKYAMHFIEGPNQFDWDTDVDSYSFKISLDLVHGCLDWMPENLITLYSKLGQHEAGINPFDDPAEEYFPYWCIVLTLEDYHS
jgi:hypothetical protein